MNQLLMARELAGSEIRRLRAIRRRLDSVDARRGRLIVERDALIAELLEADAPVAGVARELGMTRQGVYNAQLRRGRPDRA